MSRVLQPVFAMILLAGFAGSSTADAQTELRWKFKPGEELRYQLEQNLTVDALNVGQNLQTKFVVALDSVWKVKSVDEQGIATVDASFERIRFKMSQALHEMDYDSQAEEKPDDVASRPLVHVLDGMINQPFTLKVSSRGEISDFAVPPKLDAQFKAMPAAGSLSLFTPSGLQALFADTLIAFPESIEAGKSWKRASESAAPQLGKEKSTHEYTYVGREERDGRKLDKLTVKSTLAFEVPEGAPVQVTVKDQKSSGTIWFDPAAGQVVDGSSDQQAEIELALAGNKITQKLSAKATIKRITKP